RTWLIVDYRLPGAGFFRFLSVKLSCMLVRIINAVVKEVQYSFRPAQTGPGIDVEQYAFNTFFPDTIYNTIHRNRWFKNINDTKIIEGGFTPDFQLEVKNDDLEFYVECKCRENKYGWKQVTVFNPGEPDRYKEIKNCFLLLCAYDKYELRFFLVPSWQI